MALYPITYFLSRITPEESRCNTYRALAFTRPSITFVRDSRLLFLHLSTDTVCDKLIRIEENMVFHQKQVLIGW